VPTLPSDKIGSLSHSCVAANPGHFSSLGRNENANDHEVKAALLPTQPIRAVHTISGFCTTIPNAPCRFGQFLGICICCSPFINPYRLKASITRRAVGLICEREYMLCAGTGSRWLGDFNNFRHDRYGQVAGEIIAGVLGLYVALRWLHACTTQFLKRSYCRVVHRIRGHLRAFGTVSYPGQPVTCRGRQSAFWHHSVNCSASLSYCGCECPFLFSIVFMHPWQSQRSRDYIESDVLHRDLVLPLRTIAF
jgi:hypothetical protein